MLGAMIRILLAEDDESMRVYLARALERSGYEVVAVATGTQAVPYIDSDRFDLLLLILVAVIGIGLFVAFVSQLYGISILAKEPNQVHTLRHHVIRRESRSICTRPFLFLQIMPFAQDSNARPPSPQKDSLGFKTLY